ncbi:GGDEF domain-containing protein [Dyella humi]|uniref:diguanylate cyclase n=1 Tax=Dyella humi TaxID=1770547 RepID=A0ABW8IL32_9GAMM
MKTADSIAPSTSQLDTAFLKRFAVVQNACMTFAALIAVAILLAWLFKDLRAGYPGGWYLMKFDTATGMLLSAVSLALLSVDSSPARGWGGRAAAFLVLLLAVVALYEHASGRLTGFDTLIVTDTTSDEPGLMSVQTAVYLLLMALSLLVATVPHRLSGTTVVVLSVLLALHALIIFSGYCFGAVQLFGQNLSTRTAPHTLACMMLLAVALIGWRTQRGYFPALAGAGLGSRLARKVLPFALLLPFVLMLGSTLVASAGWLSPPVAVGLTVAVMAAALGALVSLMGRRINTLEKHLRELSLTDELTGVLNHRGFELLGEQAFREAQRSQVALTLLVFNVEGVKEISETYGQAAGSQLIQDMARMLRESFEPADIVARTESDEFTVITKDENTRGVIALMRIGEAMEALNAAGCPYKARFSVGEATSSPDSSDSFRDLVERAIFVRRERRRVERVFSNEPEREVSGAKPSFNEQ